MKLYIVNDDTNRVVETITADSYAECEAIADELTWCPHRYSRTYVDPRPNRGEALGLIAAWLISDSVATALKNS